MVKNLFLSKVTIPSKGAYLSLVRTAGGKKSVWEAGIAAVEAWQEVAKVPLDPTAGAVNVSGAGGSAINLRLMMAQANADIDDDDAASVQSHQSSLSVDEAGALDGL